MPYAIFEKLTQSRADVEELVMKKLGPRYCLGGVIDLQELGLKDWPYTAVGKLSVIDLRREIMQRNAFHRKS
jgi:hypothetical protein